MRTTALLLFVALFFMCVPYTRNVTLLNDVPLEPVKADWESYGA